MTTATKIGTWTSLSLSKRHEGQIVTPIVEIRINGHDRYTVRLAWRDRSEARDTPIDWSEHAGTSQECHAWLRGQGVAVDDHRL